MPQRSRRGEGGDRLDAWNKVAPEEQNGAREVLILNLDTFANKNVGQIAALEREGYGFTIVTNDIRGNSRGVFDAQGFERSRLIVLGGFRAKLTVPWKLLRQRRFNHVELYPAGRMALLNLFLLKLFRHKVLVIERGDIDSLEHYGLLVRASLKLAYRLADFIIYKEVYMQAPLRWLSRAPLVLIPNSVPEREVDRSGPRTLDFLWVNRMVPQRRPHWVAAALADPRLEGRSLAMLGFEDRETLEPHVAREQARAREVAGPGAELLGFQDPEPFYRRARFFCLPGSIVFGNNALLEAMASGVVPIVTEAPGVDRLVEDGVNGFVTPLEEASYREAMVRAAALAEAQWLSMSAKAVETVQKKHSVQAWTREMAEVYARLAAA